MLLSYQTLDRKSTGFLYNTKKAIQRPQTKRARDHESPYTSILPNPGQKANWILYNTKKVIHPPRAKGARDPKSSYASSILNKAQKVKPPAKYLLLHFINMGYTNIRRIRK